MLSMWGKLMIPMYRLQLQGLYGLCCPLSPERLLNLIIHSFISQWSFIWKCNNCIFFFTSCCCDLLAVVLGLSSASHLPRPSREGDPVPVSPRIHERSISQLTQQCQIDVRSMFIWGSWWYVVLVFVWGRKLLITCHNLNNNKMRHLRPP